jgi:hypothetical protein
MACSRCCRPLDRYERAALVVENALHGRRPAPPTPASVIAASVYHHGAYRLFYAAVMVLQLCLAYVEAPTLLTLTPAQAAAVTAADFFALALVAFDLGLQYVHHGAHVWATRGWIRIKAATLVGLTVNLVVTLAVPSAPYALRCLRPVFLIERLRNVRQVAINIASSAPRILNVLVLMGIHLLVFTVLGFVLFAGISDDSCRPFRAKNATFCSTFDPTCSDYFNTFGGTFVQLFELLTAANFPQLALPAYNCDPSSSLYFAAFLVIGVYLILSLTLAVAANTFQSLMADEVVAKFGRAFAGYDMAWGELATLAPVAAAGGSGAPPQQQQPAASSSRQLLVAQQHTGGGVDGGALVPLSPPPAAALPSSAAGGGGVVVKPPTQLLQHHSGQQQQQRLLVRRDDFVRFLGVLRPRIDPDAVARLFAVFDVARGVGGSGSGEGGGLDALAFRQFWLHFGSVSIRRKRRRAAGSSPARSRLGGLFASSSRAAAGSRSSSAGGAGGSISEGDTPVGGGTPDTPGGAAAVAVELGGAAPPASDANDGGSVADDDDEGSDAEIETLDMEALSATAPAAAAVSFAGQSTSSGGGGDSDRAAPGGGGAAAVVPNPLAAAAAASSSADRAARVTALATPPRGGGAGGRFVTPGAAGEVELPEVAGWGSSSGTPGGGGAARRRPSPAAGATSALALAPADAAASCWSSFAAAMSSITTSDGYPGEPAVRFPRGVAPNSARGRGIALMRKTAVMLAFDAAIVVNTAAVLTQVCLENDEEASTGNPTVVAMERLELAMLAVFLGEILAKVALWGPLPYWRESRFNRLDALLVVLAVVGTGLDYTNTVSDQVSAATSFVRFLRLVRVLRVVPGFGLTVGAFSDVLPVLVQYALCVVASFYFFGLVGMTAFGGKLVAANPAVAASSYGQEEYYPFSFDSLPRAGMSLLFLLALNDWPVLMDGAVAATGDGAIVYFVAFWLVNIVLILNVIIAFLIESFTAQKTKREMLARLEAAAAARAAAARFPKTSHAAGAAVVPAAAAAAAAAVARHAPSVDDDDWRGIVLRSGVDFSAYHLSRTAHHFDVYEELYREQLVRAYPDTYGPLRNQQLARLRG